MLYFVCYVGVCGFCVVGVWYVCMGEYFGVVCDWVYCEFGCGFLFLFFDFDGVVCLIRLSLFC